MIAAGAADRRLLSLPSATAFIDSAVEVLDPAAASIPRWVEPAVDALWADLASSGASKLGRFLFLDELRESVRNACLIDHVRDHPETSPISEALVVGGLPRTGTTLLHNLLALDPTSKPLRACEALRPIGGQGIASPATRSLTRLRTMRRLAPELVRAHPMSVLGPEECNVLLMSRLASDQFGIYLETPSYSSWLDATHWEDVYRWHRRTLGLISAPVRTGRWLLKSPWHAEHYEALSRLWTKLIIVEVKRDVDRVIESWAELICAARRAFGTAVDRERILRQWRPRLESRADWPPAPNTQIISVIYEDLVAHPTTTVECIYNAADLDMPPRLTQRIRTLMTTDRLRSTWRREEVDARALARVGTKPVARRRTRGPNGSSTPPR